MGKEDSVVYFTQRAYKKYQKYNKKDWAAGCQIVMADYYLMNTEMNLAISMTMEN